MQNPHHHPLSDEQVALRRFIRRAGRNALPHGFSYCDANVPNPPTMDEVSHSACQRMWEAEASSLTSLIAPHGRHFASSTDHPSQGIHNLCYDDASFWSSDGSLPSSGATLLFQLKSPCALISSITLSVYRANYQHGEPIYPPKSMSIWLGSSPTQLVQASPVYPVELSDHPQYFAVDPSWSSTSTSFPHPLMAGYVMIKLHGRQQIQLQDLRHYIAIRHVKVNGLEISPHETALLMRTRTRPPPLLTKAEMSVPRSVPNEGAFVDERGMENRKSLAAKIISTLSKSLDNDLKQLAEKRSRARAALEVIARCFRDMRARSQPLLYLLSLIEGLVVSHRMEPVFRHCHRSDLMYILSTAINLDLDSFVKEHNLILRVWAMQKALSSRSSARPKDWPEADIRNHVPATDLGKLRSMLEVQDRPFILEDDTPMDIVDSGQEEKEEKDFEEEEEEEQEKDMRAALTLMMRDVVSAGMREQREEELRWHMAERAFELMQRRVRERGLRLEEEEEEGEGLGPRAEQGGVRLELEEDGGAQRSGGWSVRPLRSVLEGTYRVLDGTSPLFVPQRMMVCENEGYGDWLVDELDTWHYAQAKV